MIKKLMKYDLIELTKILIYIYFICIGLAGITRVIKIFDDMQIFRIIGSVCSGLTYSAMASIIINTFIYILMNFITSFYKDPSYLTHTLPIKKDKLLLSKYLSSILVILLSVLVCFVSAFIMLYSASFVENLRNLLTVAMYSFSMPIWVIITLFILVIFAEICASISMSFLAVIKGNQYNNKRIIKGVAWFLVCYFITSIASLIVAIFVAGLQGNISVLFANQMSEQMFITLIIVSLVVNILANVIYYLISRFEFNKGVNVD